MHSREQRIRDRAHRLWESEGRPEDQEKRHWQLAEQAIDQEDRAAQTPPAAKSSSPQPGQDKAMGRAPSVGSAAPTEKEIRSERTPKRTTRRRNGDASTPAGARAEELTRRGDRASGNT
jgi:hypothetical protein